MKVKLDENLPAGVLEGLRAAGHEADTVRDETLKGAPDVVVLDRVRHHRRVLFTPDQGIAEVRAYPPEQHTGIVRLRPGRMGRAMTLAFVRQYLLRCPRAGPDGPPGRPH